MSYADGLLSTGERILYRNKQHPFVFIWGARYSILALVFAFLVLMVRNSVGTGGINDTLANILGWATAILFFGGLAVAAWIDDPRVALVALRHVAPVRGGPLFLGDRGGRLARQQAWTAVKRTTNNTKLTNRVSPHTLRHS